MPNKTTLALPTFLITLGVLSFLAVSSNAFPNDGTTLMAIKSQKTNPVSRQQLPFSFAKMIARVSPAVVSIRTTGSSATLSDRKLQIPEPFRRFFPDEFKQKFGA